MKRCGQATLEQILLIVTIIVVAVAMRATLRRAMGGYWHSASTTMGGTPYGYGKGGATTGTTTLQVEASGRDVFTSAIQRDSSGAPRLTSEGKRGFSTTVTSTTDQEITVAENANVLQPLR